MTKQNIQLLCQYNPNNDQLEIVKSQNFDSLNSDSKYTIEDAAGDIIGAMNTTITELIKEANGSKLFAETRSFVLEFGYDYEVNLKQARAQYGEQGYRDELTAIGKSTASFLVGAAGSNAGKLASSILTSSIPTKIGGAIIGGVFSSKIYEKFAQEPIENLFSKLFSPDLSQILNQANLGNASITPKISIGYESKKQNQSEYKTETYNLQPSSNLSTFLSKYNLNADLGKYSDLISVFSVKNNLGENLNYSAFLDLKNASQEQQDQWLNQFFETSFFDLKNNVNQFESFLNSQKTSLTDFKLDLSKNLNSQGELQDQDSNSLIVSSAFDSFFENAFLKNNNLNSDLFTAKLNSKDGVLTTKYSLKEEELSFDEQEISTSQRTSRETVEVSLDDSLNFENSLAAQGFRSIEEAESDQQRMEFDYSRITNNLMRDLGYEQKQFIDVLNENLEDFIANNPSVDEEQVDTFLRGYDNAWKDMIQNEVAYWQASVDQLVDEYESITYYDPESIEYEYFVGDLNSDLEGDWEFDPRFDGQELIGHGYWEPISAFAIDDMGEYSDYWYNFDNNNDGLIDEYEYDEDWGSFVDWYFNEYWGWDSPDEAFDYAHDVNFDEYWAYVDEDYYMKDFWEVNAGMSFETINSAVDYSQMHLENFISANSWSLDIANSWQPSDISFDINFNGNFDFNLDELVRDFNDYQFNFRYQPTLNLEYINLDIFRDQNYWLIEADPSALIVSGNEQNNIINASENSFQINGGAGFDIINGGIGNEEINAGQDNDMLFGNAGNNILRGEEGDDVYVFNSENLANDELIDDGATIIIDNKILAGIALQQGENNLYQIGSYFATQENNNLKIFYKNSSITIQNFKNKSFGIDLNHNPKAHFENAEINEDSSVVFDVLSSAFDIDSGDVLSLYSITAPQFGKAEIIDGKIHYQPNQDFNGADSLKYLIGDGLGGFVEKTLSIKVNEINDAPVVEDISTQTLNEDSSLKVNLLQNAYDIENQALSVRIIQNPQNGLANLNSESGELIYNPNLNFFGDDFIEYEISDSAGENVRKILNFKVLNINDAPQINFSIGNISAKIAADFSFKIPSNLISDIDGDILQFQLQKSDSSALPTWLNFNSQTLEISGKPTDQAYGLNNLTLIAFDGLNEIKTNFGLIIDKDLEAKTGAKIIMADANNNLISSSKNTADFFDGNDEDNKFEFQNDSTWNNEAFFAFNPYTEDLISIFNKIKSFDAFDGKKGYDILNLTNNNDAIFLDDSYSANSSKTGTRLSGIEEINAGKGDDVIDFSSEQYVYGDVVINGEDGDDILWGNDGNDKIFGGNGKDNIIGGRGNDELFGNFGNDILKGYDGDDKIFGGNGADILFGGIGNDQFIFKNLTDSTISESADESDLILDFTKGEDKINLSGLGFDEITIQSQNKYSTQALKFYFDGKNTIIEDRNSSFGLKLAGDISLDNNDFTF